MLEKRNITFPPSRERWQNGARHPTVHGWAHGWVLAEGRNTPDLPADKLKWYTDDSFALLAKTSSSPSRNYSRMRGANWNDPAMTFLYFCEKLSRERSAGIRGIARSSTIQETHCDGEDREFENQRLKNKRSKILKYLLLQIYRNSTLWYEWIKLDFL